MKAHDLLEAVGDIDEQYINNAAKTKVEKKNNSRKWVTVVAACLCLVVLAGITASKLSDSGKKNGSEFEGVYIPAIEVPKPSDTYSSDAFGVVVFKGRIYTGAGIYSGENARRVESLVGEHLGTAKGSIDEWSSQDEYATEFASTFSGEVYAVNGYDTSFRICIYEKKDNNINIYFFNHLNDVTLTKGSDLFEDRLHISERIERIQFQTHRDWNYGRGNIQDADIDDDAWNKFINAVDNCDFIDAWTPDIADKTIYDTNKQAHLFLTMNDGTEIPLRLIEGGYVGYDHLAWYFVKIPEDAFNAIYDACGGKH